MLVFQLGFLSFVNPGFELFVSIMLLLLFSEDFQPKGFFLLSDFAGIYLDVLVVLRLL
jgi:hypothetical protein